MKRQYIHPTIILLAVFLAPALSAQSRAEKASRVFATQPGIGLGVLIGVDGVGGGTNGMIQNGFGFDGFLRYGMPFGLFLLGGVHVSSHGIEQLSESYTLSSFYLEPRYFALRFSPRWAPYVAGRIGLTVESIDQPGSRLTASGHTLAGGVGAVYRLAPQLALEGGLSIGTTKFGDYTFQGELAWYECLNELEDGTPLTQSVTRCTGSSSGPQYSCYPPYYDQVSGNCTPPEIPYEGTGRSQTWVRFSVGVHLSLVRLR